MQFFDMYDSPLGEILLCEEDGALTGLSFSPFAAQAICGSKLLDRAKEQLRAYFARELTEFSLPLAPRGTEFQRRVWGQLALIPYGATVSYADIAYAIGAPRAFRAVGGANGRNPIPIIIPCHRVIAANGGLGGFSAGLDKKRFLLGLEHGA